MIPRRSILDYDGFCLFDSKLTDFKAPAYCGRDLIREFVDAFRAEGLRVGLYYSSPSFCFCR